MLCLSCCPLCYLLKQNSAFSLCCFFWVPFMSIMWSILRTQRSCLACVSHLLTFQHSLEHLWPKAQPRHCWAWAFAWSRRCCCQHLHWGLEEWGVREHFLHTCCAFLYIFAGDLCNMDFGKDERQKKRKKQKNKKPALAFSLPGSPMPTGLFQRLVMLYMYFDILCMQTYLPLGLGVYLCDCLWPWCSEQTIFAFEMQ